MILIVAHLPETRDALLPLVEAAGHPVAAIDCDDELRTRLRFQKPALVILDCGLPGSFETLKIIRSEPRAAGLPVVMFSVDDPSVKEKALAHGVDAYVPKGSLDWAELLAEIQNFVPHK